MSQRINSLSQFIEEISRLNNKNIFYRAHDDNRYKILPSIYRKDEVNKDMLVKYEHEMVQECIINNPIEFQNVHLNFEKLVLMQHYGLPTRLLDLTENPLVALYFACINKNNKKKDSEYKDGEVIIFEIDEELIKYYDSDTVSVLSVFAKIPQDKFNELDKELKEKVKENKEIETVLKKRMDNSQLALITIDNYIKSTISKKIKEKQQTIVSHLNKILNECGVLEYINYEIQQEKPHFRKVIEFKHFNNAIVCVKPKLDNQRVLSQRGLFLLFGIKDGNKNKYADLPDGIKITKLTISKESKIDILKDLEKIGISHDKIYPELDKSIESIKNRYIKYLREEY